MYGLYYYSSYILLIPALLLSAWAQWKVNRAYRIYQRIPCRRNLTGAEVARRLLDSKGLYGIRIEQTRGTLSDHFDPRKEVVRLSPDVYHGTSLASVSIAAHETGHAMQYGSGYAPLQLRNTIAVPVNLMSKASWPLLIIGIVILNMGYYMEGNLIFTIGALAFGAVVLFHLITLPVELNASHRAIKELQGQGLIYGDEVQGARRMLSAAAMTYLAALAVAAAQFLRILLMRGRRR